MLISVQGRQNTVYIHTLNVTFECWTKNLKNFANLLFFKFFSREKLSGISLCRIFRGNNFREFAQNSRKSRQFLSAKVSSFKVLIVFPFVKNRNEVECPLLLINFITNPPLQIGLICNHIIKIQGEYLRTFCQEPSNFLHRMFKKYQKFKIHETLATLRILILAGIKFGVLVQSAKLNTRQNFKNWPSARLNTRQI